MIEYGNQHLNINGGSDRAEGLQEAPEPSSVQQSSPFYWKDIYRTSPSRLTVRPSVENVSHTFYQLIWHRYSPLYWTQSHLDRVQSNSVVLIQTTRPKRSFNPKSVSIGEAMFDQRCSKWTLCVKANLPLMWMHLHWLHDSAFWWISWHKCLYRVLQGWCVFVGQPGRKHRHGYLGKKIHWDFSKIFGLLEKICLWF